VIIRTFAQQVIFYVTDRARSQCFPLKRNNLTQVLGIASVVKAGGKLICEIIQ
jgi:hypothetical protein